LPNLGSGKSLLLLFVLLCPCDPARPHQHHPPIPPYDKSKLRPHQLERTDVPQTLADAVKNATLLFVNQLQVRVDCGVAENFIVVAQANFGQ
jgi:hypothetical protein